MSNKKNSILFHIVGILLLIPTIFFFYNGFNVISGVIQSKNWKEVNAEVLNYEIIKSRKKTSNIAIKANYKYEINNQVYTNSKIDFSFISININKKRINKQIEYIQNKNIKIYVNPKNPEESVIDRSIPIEELNFTTIFLATIGFLGFSWLFGIITNFKKPIIVSKIILIIPFIFSMLCPISIFIIGNGLEIFTILLNIGTIILMMVWYKSSLKYVKDF